MENKYHTDEKRITCFLPKGVGIRLVEILHNEKNIDSTNVHAGRGLPTSENAENSETWMEQDILTVIVDAAKADEIFEFIFSQGELNKPGGGFIYQASLIKASEYRLPNMAG